MINNKRGVSPVVATVLLIAIVIVIGLVVFMWFRGITEEAITKFDGTNVKLVCEDVVLDASYSGGYLYLSNTGNVPVYKIKAKIEGSGGYDTLTLSNDWPTEGLLQGARYAGELTATAGSTITLTPVLVGSTSEGEKTHTCEDRHSIDVSVD